VLHFILLKNVKKNVIINFLKFLKYYMSIYARIKFSVFKYQNCSRFEFKKEENVILYKNLPFDPKFELQTLLKNTELPLFKMFLVFLEKTHDKPCIKMSCLSFKKSINF